MPSHLLHPDHIKKISGKAKPKDKGEKGLLGRIKDLEKRLAKLEQKKARKPGKTKTASPNKPYMEMGLSPSRYMTHEPPGAIECDAAEFNLAIPFKRCALLLGYTISHLFIEEDDGGEEDYSGNTISAKLRLYLK